MEHSSIRITNKTAVRSAFLTAVLIITVALLAGCGTDPAVSGPEQSADVQERIPFDDDFSVLLEKCFPRKCDNVQRQKNK